MNFGELVETSIAQVISLTATDQLVNANEEFVKRMVNRGYHTIERRALWKFSEAEAEITAIADTRVCPDVPADMAVPMSVYSPRLQTEIQYHDERQRRWEQTTRGGVEAYGIWSGNFNWYPLPKATETLNLRYYYSWSDLVADTDEPVIPATWHDLLTDYASGQLALRLPPTGDRFLPNSKAQPWLDAFSVRLEEMANSDLVVKTWDAIPNYDFEDHVLGMQEW